jgi:hypothetical protein
MTLARVVSAIKESFLRHFSVPMKRQSRLNRVFAPAKPPEALSALNGQDGMAWLGYPGLICLFVGGEGKKF